MIFFLHPSLRHVLICEMTRSCLWHEIPQSSIAMLFVVTRRVATISSIRRCHGSFAQETGVVFERRPIHDMRPFHHQSLCMYVCVYVCMCIFYVCLCVCLHVYIHVGTWGWCMYVASLLHMGWQRWTGSVDIMALVQRQTRLKWSLFGRALFHPICLFSRSFQHDISRYHGSCAKEPYKTGIFLKRSWKETYGCLRLVGSLKLQVSFAEYVSFIGLFCKRVL